MILESFLNVLFPSRCIGCAKQTMGGDIICVECFGRINTNKTLLCGQCRARLPEGKKICHARTPYLLGAATMYNDSAVKDMIHALKFRFLKKSGDTLGKLLIRYASSVVEFEEILGGGKNDIAVVPIPLSPQRMRERGFNQSEIIARVFAEHFALNIESGCMIRIRDTKPQSETGHVAERIRNTKGCFSIMNAQLLRGKTIILVDDVITSGATIRAAAEEFKRAGVKQIIALTVAHA